MQHASLVSRRKASAQLPRHLQGLVGGKRPIRRSSDARSSPSMNSIVRKTRPCTSPTSYTRQTFGWETLRALRTSASSRSRAIGLRLEFRRKELQRDRLARGARSSAR